MPYDDVTPRSSQPRGEPILPLKERGKIGITTGETEQTFGNPYLNTKDIGISLSLSLICLSEATWTVIIFLSLKTANW